MKARIAAMILLSFFLLCAAAGCGSAAQETAVAVAQMAVEWLSGDKLGEVGVEYHTRWFDFTIKSVETVDSYAGYTPQEGYQLVDVVILETGTFDEPTLMGTADFYIDEASFEEYIWPMDPFDETMMPLEFDLEKDQTVKYHMVYEIPDHISEASLMFTELGEYLDDGETESTESEADSFEGATFTISISLR